MNTAAWDDFKQQVRKATSLLSLIREAGADLHKSKGSPQHTCLCLFHPEKKASMSATDEFYNCHKCGAKGDVFTFIEQTKSLDFKEALRYLADRAGILYPLGPNGQNGQDGSKRKVIRVYDYGDFQAVRTEPKGFYQRRPDGNGGFISNLDGVKLTLYHADRLTDAQYVYIVEGEKDVETLEALGLTATTNPMGAGKWRAEYAEHFKPHHHVVILVDNDEAGEKHGQDVARSLHRRVASVRVLRLPGLALKGDVSDFVKGKDAIAAAEELSALSEACPEWPPESEVSNTLEATAFRARDLVCTVAEFIKKPVPKRKPAIDGFVGIPGLVMVYAPRGRGKSFFRDAMARSTGAAETFLSHWPALQEHVSVIFDGEMADCDSQERFIADMADSPRAITNVHYVSSQEVFSKIGRYLNLNTTEDQELVFSILREMETEGHKPEVLFFDNLSCLAPTEENSNTEQEA